MKINWGLQDHHCQEKSNLSLSGESRSIKFIIDRATCHRAIQDNQLNEESIDRLRGRSSNFCSPRMSDISEFLCYGNQKLVYADKNGCRHLLFVWPLVDILWIEFSINMRGSLGFHLCIFWGFDFLKCIPSLFSCFLVSFDATLWAKIQRAYFLCFSSCFYIYSLGFVFIFLFFLWSEFLKFKTAFVVHCNLVSLLFFVDFVFRLVFIMCS